jgi:hypothetical protein
MENDNSITENHDVDHVKSKCLKNIQACSIVEDRVPSEKMIIEQAKVIFPL